MAIQWLWASLEDTVAPFKDFPPQDLMDSLVEHYFREMNDYFPLLHEPTFKQCIQNGFHHRHGAFGATVLLVCANGARFSDDPRVLWQGSENRQSAGWKWFDMVERVHKSFIAYAHVYDLQIRVVRRSASRSQYLAGASRSTRTCTFSCWWCTCKGRPRLTRVGRISGSGSVRASISAPIGRGCTGLSRLSSKS